MRKFGFLLFLLGNVMWFAACGSSNGGSGTVTSVSVSCSPSTVGSGGTSQCSATVGGTGNFSSTVTWSTTAGSISTSGLLTAPTVSSSTSVTVTATSTQNTSVSGTATVTVTTTGAANLAPIIVDSGPQNIGTVNVAFVTVTVCIPGTTTCQTIDHVQVDTGSEGLRLLSSASGGEFNLSLPSETSGGNSVDECLVFADGYVWGPVNTATVTVSGETATNVPVQLMIPATSSPGVPSTCSSQNPSGGNGNEGGSLMAFGANGLIGVGPFQNDCGDYCADQGSSCNGTSGAPCVYYTCTSSGSCSATNLGNSQQVPNPVTGFTDSNGVLIQLPSVPDGGSSDVSGSLIFGINTQSNNNLNLAGNVYQIPDSGSNAGDLITTYNGAAYPNSFLDSGSNGLFFLDSSTTGIPTCTFTNGSGWYCPSTSPDNITATNQGQDANGDPLGTSGSANFSIENTSNLFNTNNTAFSTLGGPNPGAFDFGLSFFFGKNVFTAIDGATVSGAPTGPFFAY
ncbi:MAG TPA: DUF3443 family protein [Bryocella sp.]|nr:DUF3443 family protein [Bryocella sp.]